MPNKDHLTELLRVAKQRRADDVPLDMSVFWHACGTFGCLAGWAAHDPYFRQLGLQVVKGRYHTSDRTGTLWLMHYENRQFKPKMDFKALEYLFELDAYQSCYLFGNNPEITGEEPIVDWEEAVRRIEEVLNGEV